MSEMIDSTCQIEPFNIVQAQTQTFLTNNDISKSKVD